MSESEFRYWAFISYSTSDTARVKKLHRKLETYRVPRGIVGRPGRDGPVPRRLYPIFRDRDEVPLSSDLGATIQDALRASRYLIVVCSPNAAASRWVNEEVRYFKSLGRDNRIFAVMVKGEPNALDKGLDAKSECFPPALRVRVDAQGQMTDVPVEPLAGDLRPGGDGWNSVLLKSIAGITGFGYESFAKRQARRDRIKRTILAIAALVMLTAGLWAWDYWRVKVGYYAFVADRWGAPEGVSPLAQREWMGRERSFRVESRAYRVRRVDRVNGSGGPVDDPENSQASRTDVLYREDGTLERLELRDRNGRLVQQRAFSRLGEADDQGARPCTITFRSQAEFAQSLLANPADTSDGRKSDITAYQVYYRKDGRTELVLFRNSYGTPVADSSGVFGNRFEYDDHGLVTRTINVDASGKPITDRKGVGAIQRQRDNRGSETRTAYMDASQRPVPGPEGAAYIEREFDPLGNELARRFADHGATPVYNTEGYVSATFTYDERGNWTGGRYFGAAGEPVRHRDGMAAFASEFDERGNNIRRTTFGPDGAITPGKSGYAIGEMTFDERGNILSSMALDTQGKPIDRASGRANVVATRDGRGNILTMSNFDSQGRPGLNDFGIHKIVQTYDLEDRSLTRRFLGPDLKPAADKSGVAGVDTVYDERGNEVLRKYLGVDGKLVPSSDGYAQMTSRYDERGNMVERGYLGVTGEAVVSRDGYAGFTQVYDDRGNLIEQTHLDALGAPTLNRDGVSRVKRRYDELGRNVRTDYLGIDGMPILDKKGRARVTREFDTRGEIAVERYFGVDGRPAANADGTAAVITVRDERGRTTSVRFLGVNARAATNTRIGGARIDTVYDERGNIVEIALFGELGEAVAGGEDKVWKRARVFDARNTMTQELYYGVNAQPSRNVDGLAGKLVEYDDRGNPVSQIYLGLDAKPGTDKAGVGRVGTVFDAMGMRVEESYWDKDGRAMRDRDGVHKTRNRFDQRGNLVEQSFFGVDGKPTTAVNGVAKSQRIFDAHGNVLEEAYYGVDGALTSSAQGIARQVKVYDAQGNELEQSFFGTDGRPIAAQDGHARSVVHRDAAGRVIEMAFFGADGQPVVITGENRGYARVTKAYDVRGNTVELAYWGARGEPVLCADRAARVIRRYDDHGTLVEARFLGVDGNLTMGSGGFARSVQTVDDQGRVTETAYFDAQGRPVLTPLGYARRTAKLDNAGNVIDEATYAPDGTPAPAANTGVWRTLTRYSADGYALEIERVGVDGKPLINPSHPFHELARYEQNVMREYTREYLKPENAAALPLPQSVSKAISRYDAAGNALGADGFEPVRSPPQGCTAAVEHTQYNGLGQVIATRYLDAAGELVVGPEGIAFGRFTPDEEGRPKVVEGFDAHGQPALMLGALWRAEISYDTDGREIEYRSFGIDRLPVKSDEAAYLARMTRYPNGQVAQRTQWFELPEGKRQRGKEGSLPVRLLQRYDQAGKIVGNTVWRELWGSSAAGDLVLVARTSDEKRVVELRYCDAQDRMIPGPEGYARATYDYDAAGQLAVTRYFDPSGAPCDNNLGIASQTTVRDTAAGIVEYRMFDAAGKPAPDADGVSRHFNLLDAKGRRVKTEYFLGEQLVRNRSKGYARVIVECDDAARTILERYEDETGRPTPGPQGSYRVLVRNDQNGRRIQTNHLDQDGKPMATNLGLATIAWRYPTADVTETVSLDTSGLPMVNAQGYVKGRQTRDAKGNVVRDEYFDAQDRPVAGTEVGACRVDAEYDGQNRMVSRRLTFLPGSLGAACSIERMDEAGNVAESRNLDADGTVVPGKDGVAIVKYEYDWRGWVVAERCFDPAGTPTMATSGYHAFLRKYAGAKVAEFSYQDVAGKPAVGPGGWSRMVRADHGRAAAGTWSALDDKGQPARTEVVVERVAPATQAAKVGVLAGDVLRRYQGVPIVTSRQLTELIDAATVESRVLMVDREGKELVFTVGPGTLGIIMKSRPSP